MQLGPFQVTLVDVLITSNAVATCMLGWQSWRTERRAIRAEQRAEHWERVARGVAARVKRDSAKTIVAPAWHAPRTATPGQRLAHLVHTAADFRVEAED